MKEVYEFLESSNVLYLATIKGNVPSLRPFSDAFMFNDKIYIITGRSKDVYKQLSENNSVCIVAYHNDEWVRINCELKEDASITARKEAIEKIEWAKYLGYGVENNEMVVFYLDKATASIYNIDGNTILSTTF